MMVSRYPTRGQRRAELGRIKAQSLLTSNAEITHPQTSKTLQQNLVKDSHNLQHSMIIYPSLKSKKLQALCKLHFYTKNYRSSKRPGSRAGDPHVNDLVALKYLPDGTIEYKLDLNKDWPNLEQRVHRNIERESDVPSLYTERLPISAKNTSIFSS